MNTKLTATLLAFFLLSVYVVSCVPVFKDGSGVYIDDIRTDNPYQDYQWGPGDRLIIKGHSRIDPEEVGDRWLIRPVLEKAFTDYLFLCGDAILYERNEEDPEDWNYHEWSFLFDDVPLINTIEPDCYPCKLLLQRQRKELLSPDYVDIGWAMGSDDWFIEVIRGKGDPVGGFTGIIPFCGDERYGGPAECLDYPIAFPLAAQVFRDGKPAYGETVKFTILSNDAFFVGQNPNEVTGTTQKTLIGDVSKHSKHNNDSCGCEEVEGIFKCPLYIKSTPNDDPFEVKAEWLNPPGGADVTTTSFKITPVPYGECDGLLDDKGDLFHEKDASGKLILGDGLWSYWEDPSFNPIYRDPDPDTKEIQLEIDWMSNLGQDFNGDGKADIQLTFADIEYICAELNKIFNEVGIIIDPVIDLQDTEHHDWEAASVASKMDAHSDWSDDSKSKLLKAYLEKGKTGGYTDDMLRNILTITRGDDLQGKAIWYVGEPELQNDRGVPENIPHYVRRRLHIVLLPGFLKNDSPKNIMGCSRDIDKFDVFGSPLRLASGSDVNDNNDVYSNVIRWSQGASASSSEFPIDGGGCCIFTGTFPDVNDEEKVVAGWVSPYYNPYCWIFTAIIAHEIGHSLGLAEETIDRTNIMYQDYIISDKYLPYRNKGFKSISPTNCTEGKYINLRKMLGRETITNRW